MKIYDVILLTESRYENPKEVDDYIQNILTEDGLVDKALEKLKCNVYRTSWDNKNEPSVSEFELIEPELWFGFKPESADHQAKHIYKKLRLLKS